MLARGKGKDASINDHEKYDFPEPYAEAKKRFARYSKIMLDYYRNNVKAMPGTEETFGWCKKNNIKVATGTGFHNDGNRTVLEQLQWLEKGLVAIRADVESTNGLGRPAPFLLFETMMQLGVQSVLEVIKIDPPGDLLSGQNAGRIGNIGALNGANSGETLEKHQHPHVITSVMEPPFPLDTEFTMIPFRWRHKNI